MFLEIDNLEEFMTLLKTSNPEETPVYVGQLTEYDANGVRAKVDVVAQFELSENKIAQFRESIGAGLLPRDEKDEYGKKSTEDLQKKADDQLKKAEEAFKEAGFPLVIHGIWTE